MLIFSGRNAGPEVSSILDHLSTGTLKTYFSKSSLEILKLEKNYRKKGKNGKYADHMKSISVI